MANYAQFILCQLVRKEQKIQKLPINPHTLAPFEKGEDWQKNPAMWAGYEHVATLKEQLGEEYLIGFLFTENDPFFFVDLDNCISDGSWGHIANDIFARFPGAAIEISTSGTGAHLFGCYSSIPDHKCKNSDHGIEMYHRGRFVALTEDVTGDGTIWLDHTAALYGLVESYFPHTETEFAEWTTDPDPTYTAALSDEDLIARAIQSKSVAAKFGQGVSFQDLWECNVDILAQFYPPSAGGDFDRSTADAALAQHLAFWTGNDCERMVSLMFQSALVRDKWNRDDYVRRTVLHSVSKQKTFYTPQTLEIQDDEPSDKPRRRSGGQFMPIDLQAEYFDGCVYVISENRIYCPRSGRLLKQDQFNGRYGGYTFQMDDENKGKPTRKAWEAFLDCQGLRWPRVDGTCFRPRIPPGAVIKDGGDTLVNVYKPIITPSIPGDVTPFTQHLQRLIPDDRDRLILTSYMAACVQYKGCKFQWAPLIQGVEGNGKSFISEALTAAIGDRYVHTPIASELAEKYNSWNFNKLLICVEDVYLPDGKREIIEILKPLITSRRYAKRAMHSDQEMCDLCGNWVLNSNHKDAVAKTRNDRRFAPFYTAQQTTEDLIRDGVTEQYLIELYAWAKDKGGFAHVTYFLENFDIPAEYNPAVQEGGQCARAPRTTSTDEAISVSMGGAEQEILEAIEQETVGFAGGWVSSVALDRLLRDIRKSGAIPYNKRTELMESLGYQLHPKLNGGRASKLIDLDQNKRPRLYVKSGHISCNMATGAAVTEAYIKAQSASRGGESPPEILTNGN